MAISYVHGASDTPLTATPWVACLTVLPPNMPIMKRWSSPISKYAGLIASCSGAWICSLPGYWGDDEKTAETIDTANWLHSGDIAILDKSGYCQIVGRLKDMLIRGGENIFPREIEEYLFQHPKVEAAEVIGVPDNKYGEEICAWLKLREGEVASEDEIRHFCSEKIAHFKIPRYIPFVDELPMTVTGKVRKFKMREQTLDILGLDKNS